MSSANDLIQRISNAIIKQEGMPDTYTNPGNLRSAPWIQNPVIKNNFWVPRSRSEGIAGIVHCVALRIAEGQSLIQLISAWAPPSDGNATQTYIQNVKDWCNIPNASVPLLTYIEQ